jgi:ATP-dependent DNA ligase
LAFVERVKNDLGVKAAHRDGHLRHSKFVGLREDKDPKAVREALDRATSAAL